jgi:hypothetical protein
MNNQAADVTASAGDQPRAGAGVPNTPGDLRTY